MTTRRSLRALAAVLVATSFAVACASSDDDAEAPLATPPPAAGVDGAAVTEPDAGVPGADGGDDGDASASADAEADAAFAPRTVNGAPQRIALLGSEGDTVGTIGTLWGGYASFTASTTCPICSDFPADLVDGFGNVHRVIESPPSVVVRMKTPITVKMGGSNSGVTDVLLKLESVVLDLTSLSVPAVPLIGKADVTGMLPSVYGDLAGVALDVTVDAAFFANFTSPACAQIEVLSNGTKVAALTAASPKTAVAVTAPLGFRTAPTCITSRLPAPESATTDFALHVTRVALP